MKSIEKEELERLRDANQKLYSLKNNIAEIELSIRALELNKSSVFTSIDELSVEFKSLEKELTEKYGNNVSINLETGNIQE
jgi:chromosome segregation ATPase